MKSKHNVTYIVKMKSKHNVTYSWDILQFKLKESLDLDLENTRTTLLDLD